MKNFDQHIKDKLTQPQVPPLDAWKNIEQKLDDQKKKRIIPIWIATSAASVVAILGIYYFSQLNNSKNITKFEVVKSAVKPLSSSKILDQNNINSKPKIIEEKELDKVNKQENQLVKSHQDIVNSPIFELPKVFKSNENLVKNEDLVENNQEIVHQKEKNKEVNHVREEQTIEEIIAKKDNENQPLKKIKSEPKLIVSSYVAPIVLINQNSILSQEFDLNNNENKITTSYGANISYQVNEKLSLKGGIAKINLDQITKDVISKESVITPLALASQTIENGRKQNIHYYSTSTINTTKNQISALNSVSEINLMNQQIEFLEIPLELEYQLLKNKKFFITATAGGSYYLLTKNNIELTNQTLGSRSIGKATNINDSHFSANGGVKIGYDINQKISVNLQPNMRFFINQFQNSNQNSPALFGINLGLSFKLK